MELVGGSVKFQVPISSDSRLKILPIHVNPPVGDCPRYCHWQVPIHLLKHLLWDMTTIRSFLGPLHPEERALKVAYNQNFFRCSSCHLVSPYLSFMTNKNILLLSPLTAFTVSRKHRKRLTICFSREIMVRSHRPTHVFSLSCEVAFPPFALTPLDEWEPIAAHRVSASTSAYGPSMREQEAS